jgi:tetratricopeptide (TPR) repeat protein
MTTHRWLLCLFAILAGQSLAAEPTWRQVVAPHYRVISELSDRDTLAWMRSFDQYIQSTSDFLKINLAALPPLTVVIFDRDKDYTPYKLLRPNGRTASVAGQFVRRPTWSMIGMAKETDSAEQRRTLQHEATHWLMSGDQARQPAWFTEGIAEMFSTFERRGDKVNWAKPIESHLAVLQNTRMEPLAQFLIEPSAIFDRDDRTGVFYAQSWALVHFLLFSEKATRRPLLSQFLQLYKTESGETTVTTVFGSKLKDIENDFHLYIDQRSYGYMIEPLHLPPDPPPAQPAPADLVEGALGFLALGAERYDLARQHADKAITHDASSPEGHRILAYLAMENHEFAEATRQAEAAIDSGSKDSELYMVLGDSYESGANAQSPNAARARANQYENAINLNPRQRKYYERLAVALFAIDKPREDDAQFLEIGTKLYPGADWVRVGTAVVDYRLGHHEQAMSTMDAVLKPESTLDPSERTYATRLRTNWLLESMRTDIQDAANRNDYAAARALISRFRERVGDDSDAVSYLDEYSKRLDVAELMGKYSKARQAHDNMEARKLAEQLLTLPGLPGNMREMLQNQVSASH